MESGYGGISENLLSFQKLCLSLNRPSLLFRALEQQKKEREDKAHCRAPFQTTARWEGFGNPKSKELRRA